MMRDSEILHLKWVFELEFGSPNPHSCALLITTFYKSGSKVCRSELFCSWKNIFLSENKEVIIGLFTVTAHQFH